MTLVNIRQGYCSHCEKLVAANIQGIAHLTHFVLTIITCGMWAPVWILFHSAGAAGLKAFCIQCGKEVTTDGNQSPRKHTPPPPNRLHQ